MMDTQEKITTQSETSVSVAAGKKHTSGIGRPDKKTNKIGIKYDTANDTAAPSVNSRVTVLDRWLIKQVADMIGYPPLKVVLWDSETIHIGDRQAEYIPTVTLSDRGILWRMMVDPEMQFGDLYSSGRIRFDGDLAGFLSIIFRSMGDYGAGGKLRRVLTELLHYTIGNTLSRAKDNIYHHYDLSNEFYKKWLDTEAMQYTCGYFPQPEMTLEQGQVAKLHHVCRKLRLKPGDSVVEAGCGWGGLARYEEHTDEVADIFDPSFARAWYLYLASSISSFESGTLGLFQLLFSRGDNNDVPRSREYIYSASEATAVENSGDAQP